MDNKKDETVIELEDKLKRIDQDLSNNYSMGKELARTKIQEKLDHKRSDLFFL